MQAVLNFTEDHGSTRDRLVGAVYDRLMRDIEIITSRYRRAKTSGELSAWSDGDRLRHSDLRDAAISVAETASLVAFCRPGEKWRLEIAGEHTRDGAMIIAALHKLRCETLEKFRFTRDQQSKNSQLCRALALMSLSINAVPEVWISTATALAGLGRTGDPQGDAQITAEEISLSDD